MQIADWEDQVVASNGELVGLYWEDMIDYDNKPLEEVDAKMDTLGWSGGWRIQEDAARSISSTLDSAPHLFDYLPFVFIVDTSTMKIVASDSGDALNPIDVDILGVVGEIDDD